VGAHQSANLPTIGEKVCRATHQLQTRQEFAAGSPYQANGNNDKRLASRGARPAIVR
jgi:hypothetical protein